MLGVGVNTAWEHSYQTRLQRRMQMGDSTLNCIKPTLKQLGGADSNIALTYECRYMREFNIHEYIENIFELITNYC